MSITKPTVLLASAPVPRVTLRGLKLSVIMTYLVLAVMACLPIGAGAVILAQTTPTMYEHRAAPRSRSTVSSGGEPSSSSLAELRRDYDTTIPMLVSDVERLAQERAADAAYINEARTNLATMALKVDRLESYATYLMAAVSALVIGMVLQIYTKMQERKRGREENSRG